jgi:hypothetical protein
MTIDVLPMGQNWGNVGLLTEPRLYRLLASICSHIVCAYEASVRLKCAATQSKRKLLTDKGHCRSVNKTYRRYGVTGGTVLQAVRRTLRLPISIHSQLARLLPSGGLGCALRQLTFVRWDQIESPGWSATSPGTNHARPPRRKNCA